MTPIELFLGLVFAGLSFIILLISVMAARRRKELRLGLVTIAFVLYSLLAILALLSDPMGWDSLSMSTELLLINIGIVVMLYLAIVKG